nr:SH3 domain-containing protein [Clostridia bacterium]
MKRMFALLLALCLICGSYAGVAEESGGGLTVFEFPFVTLYIPTSQKYDEPEFDGELRSDVSAIVRGKAWLEYEWESNGSYGTRALQQSIIVIAQKYDKDILAEYGSIEAFAQREFRVNSIANIHGPQEAVCYIDSEGRTCYMTCLGNVTITISAKKQNNNEWSDDIWNEEMIKDVVIPIFCNAQLPEGPAAETTDAAAPAAEAAEATAAAEVESAGTQELKIGNVTFQVPAELTASGLTDMDGLYHQELLGADYSGIMLVLDYEKKDLPLNVLKGADDQINNLYCCYYTLNALYGVVNEEAALYLCNAARHLDGSMPDGQKLVYYGNEQAGFAAHYYRNIGCLVMVLSQDESIDGARCCEIALSIAGSFRIDGVTEEQMAADAEAARIAAEEAAAKAAAQKYIVITGGSANIRAKADGKSSKITTAYKGDTFPMLGQEGTWYKIEVNGQTGYVAQGLCKIKE